MKKILIIIAVIGGLVLMATVAKSGKSDTTEVRMTEVSRGRVAASVMASGKINFREIIQLRTEVTGRIKKLYVEEGDPVKAGDKLALISPELFEADVAQVRASVETRQIDIERQQIFLAQLKRRSERQEKLYKTGHVNQDAYEQVERDVAMAKLDLAARRQDLKRANANLSSAEDRLLKTLIIAPIDGIVTALNVKAGETVVAGTTNIIGSSLMDVSDPSAVMAEVEVEEADILSVEIGQDASITMAAAPDKTYKGKVFSIATTAREDSTRRNSFLVKLLVDKEGAEFSRLAINCRAEIFTKVVTDVVKIPVEAVLQDKENKSQSYVFVVENGMAQKRVIERGIETDTLIEVRSGVREGATLVTGPYRQLKNLRDNQKVSKQKPKSDSGFDEEGEEDERGVRATVGR